MAPLDDPVVQARLRVEEVMWLATVDGRGQPQSSPVWFHWDGATVLVLSQPGARKVANIGRNPLVALHLDGAGPGTSVVTLEGRAAVAALEPSRLRAYAAKYAEGFARLGTDADHYLGEFAAAITVTPTRARVFPSL